MSASLSGSHYEFDPEVDPATYFSDVIGVNLDSDYEKEKILIKVTSPRRNYLESLPLHHTQRTVETARDFNVFEFRLCAEYEFQHGLLRPGAAVEVLHPQWLRHQIMTYARDLQELNHCSED